MDVTWESSYCSHKWLRGLRHSAATSSGEVAWGGGAGPGWGGRVGWGREGLLILHLTFPPRSQNPTFTLLSDLRVIYRNLC